MSSIRDKVFVPSQRGNSSILDIRKALDLPDDEFALLYRELMDEYRDKDGWWKDKKIPYCQECHFIIPGPKYLVRSEGRSLHHSCFINLYGKERKLKVSASGGGIDNLEIKYWDRINELAKNRRRALIGA